MDHKEQHHQKEREGRKHERKEYEKKQGAKILPFHPLWLLVVGSILIAGVVLAWTLGN